MKITTPLLAFALLPLLASCGGEDGGATPTQNEELGSIVGWILSAPDEVELVLSSGRRSFPNENGVFTFVDVPPGSYSIDAVGSPYYYDETLGEAVVQAGAVTDVGVLQQTRDRYVDAVTEIQGVTNFQRVIGFQNLADWAEMESVAGNFMILDMGAGEEIENRDGYDFEIADGKPDATAAEYRVSVSTDGETFVEDGKVYRGDTRFGDLDDFGVATARFVKIMATDWNARVGIRFVRTTY
jgi:hypothetical protein